MKVKTKMFKTGSNKDKTSFYMHIPIKENMEKVAEMNGVNLSDLVTDILNEYLEACVEAKVIPPPPTSESTELIDKDVVSRLKIDKAQGA